MTNPRRFHLQREHDVTGASGTGRVADGVLWPDGTATLRWLGPRASTVHWDQLADAVAIHGHGGHTHIVWDDPASAERETTEFAELLRQFVALTDTLHHTLGGPHDEVGPGLTCDGCRLADEATRALRDAGERTTLRSHLRSPREAGHDG